MNNTSVKENTPKTYLDVLTNQCRFGEFRSNRQFTEAMFVDFLNEAATKCLDLKNKYGILGQSLSPDKLIEVCFGENIYIDTDPDNSQGFKENWFALNPDESGGCIWIGEGIEIEDGIDFVFNMFSILAFPEAAKIITSDKTTNQNDLNEVVNSPDLLKAVMLTDLFSAMLKSCETEAQLIELQNTTRETIKTRSKRNETAGATILPKCLSVDADCITEMARDLEFLLRDSVTPPRVKELIEQGVRETAELIKFDLTGKSFDIPTLINLLSEYHRQDNEGLLPKTGAGCVVEFPERKNNPEKPKRLRKAA